jgi:phosphonate transport system substrate-binding protein
MRARMGRVSLRTVWLVAAAAAVMLAAFGVAYHQQVSRTNAETAAVDVRSTGLIGLSHAAVRNALDPRYTDADGDQVADPPTDPAKLIDPATITFCYVSTNDTEDFEPPFRDLVAALGKATGKPAEYVRYHNPTDKLRAFREGKLTVCGLATGVVPLGVCTAGFVPVCQAADANGNAGYKLEVIVPAGSSLSGLASLRGHELAVTEPNSNSGYKAPLILMREKGMVPPRDYAIRFSNSHVNSIRGIKDKTFQAAAVASDVLERERNAGHIAAADFKVIYTSDQTFPSAALGIPYNLKPELAAKIRDVLLHFDFKGTSLAKLFGPEGKVRFVPADYKKDWEYVRRIDDSIGFAYTLPPAIADAPATAPAAKAK